MNLSRVSAIVLIFSLGVFLSQSALAQAPVPVPLVPAPQTRIIDPNPGPAPRTEIGNSKGPVVQIGKLTDVDPSVAGLLDETNGGLGLEMWAGSKRKRIEQLLVRLPMGSLSPAAQDLSLRLLLSTASVPEGEPRAPSLLGLRVERLMAGGHISEVNELLELAATSIDDPALSRAEVDAMILAGDNLGACNRISNLVRSDPQPYWTKALAFCRALENDTGAVSLALALLRDQGHDGDEIFFKLMSSFTGDEIPQIDSLIDPEPLHLAMLRAANQPIPADAVAGASPAILWAIATAPNDELAVRVAAAERAEAAGALNIDVLAEIYSAVPYTDEDIGVALQTAAGIQGSMANALLFQAAMFWEGDALRATALQRAWQQAITNGIGFGTSARVSLPIARTILPDSDLIWFVHDVSRALILAGDVDRAWDWLGVALEEASNGNAHAAKTANNLWPLLQIADPEGAFMRDEQRAQDWWKELSELEQGEDMDKRALMFTLFEALGDELPDSAWNPLFEAPLTITAYQPSPAIYHALRDASQSRRLAETVLLSLITLGDLGPQGADPTTLFHVIEALLRVGLAEEARSIALEAAIANGL